MFQLSGFCCTALLSITWVLVSVFRGPKKIYLSLTVFLYIPQRDKRFILSCYYTCCQCFRTCRGLDAHCLRLRIPDA